VPDSHGTPGWPEGALPRRGRFLLIGKVCGQNRPVRPPIPGSQMKPDPPRPRRALVRSVFRSGCRHREGIVAVLTFNREGSERTAGTVH
jgi:hypothetical protein